MPQKNSSLPHSRRTRKTSSAPPQAMTWGKAAPVLAVSLIFDALRFMFEQFWFFGPALAALFCSAKISGAIGTVWGAVPAVCGAGAVAVGIAGAPEIEMFGTILAMAIGLLGWLTIGAWLLLTNARIFEANATAMLWFVGGLFVSEVPIVGSVPAITITLWRMYHVQIKKDAEALKKYTQQDVEERQREQNRQVSEFAWQRNAQMEQEQEAANDADEIPDEVLEAT